MILRGIDQQREASALQAAAITKAASKQSYYTIRLLADRTRVANAYRAYAYMRWVDDVVDMQANSQVEKSAFIHYQKTLLECCYQGDRPTQLQAEERMLVDLIASDPGKCSGLKMYLGNMMDVMAFDAGRRGRVISQAELCEYTRKLAMAVTEALYYFIGHDQPEPLRRARYLAVTAAHITHMLRDAYEDIKLGYFNVPSEYLRTYNISPDDVTGAAFREWVCERVHLARQYFTAGCEYLAHDRVLRRRLAGYAYVARFEWMLGVIEQDNFCLRCEYPERKSLKAGLWMAETTLGSILLPVGRKPIRAINS